MEDNESERKEFQSEYHKKDNKMVVVETELNHINKLYKVVDLESEKMKIEIIQLRHELTTKNEQCKSFETQLRDGKSQVCVGCIAGDRSQRAFYSH